MPETITHCYECTHCFKSRRSKTGWACEVWGHDDFACDTVSDGFCHKAKPMRRADFLWTLHVFNSKEEADLVISQIKQLDQWYGLVTQADVKELLNITPNFNDRNYGLMGKSVDEIRTIQISHGWIIDFPRFVAIK